MENNLNVQENLNPEIKSERPSFVSTLCILTWICCGFIFLSTVWGIIFKPSAQEQEQQIEQMRKISSVAADKMEEAIAQQGSAGQIMNQALSLIAMGFSAFGTYLMWQLNKKGFYFYLAGEILPYAGFLFMGKTAMAVFESMGGMGGTIITVFLSLMVIFDLLFIIMYAVNLKHMTSKSLN